MARKQDKLHALASAHGVQTSYRDQGGKLQQAKPEALLKVLEALGAEGNVERQCRQLKQIKSRGFLEPVQVVWNGRGRIKLRVPTRTRLDCVVRLDSGEVLEWCERGGVASIKLPRQLPIGRHALRVRAGRTESAAVVLAAPRELPQRLEREVGLFVPLYALHSAASQGVGDLGDWRRIDRWAGGLGCRVLGTLPLLACYLDKHVFEPSPYAPISRLFWNELFIDLRDAAHLSGALRPDLGQAVEAASRWVDYRAAADCKRRVLQAMSAAAWARQGTSASLEGFVRGCPEVAWYARFRAEVERSGETWQHWSKARREGGLGTWLNERARYHVFVQWVLHRQLSAIASQSQTALYLDLPIGVHGGGYDVWRYRENFATEASVGAPPDQLFEGGQNWGFPPLHPHRSRADGHAYFAACLRNHLQYAKVLRIDHVMGIHRLFWIPRGVDTREGVYVHYPAEELLAVLSIEAHRAGARIVGENLGTVPEEVNDAMRRHRIMGMFVGQFALTVDPKSPLTRPEAGNLASLNTHDTPTFAGFLQGRDINERERMGLLEGPAAANEHFERQRLARALAAYAGRRRIASGSPAARALRALLKHLAESDAEIVLVTLEDLWLEPEPQNIPGTRDEYPCWRRRSSLSLEQITRSRALGALLRELVATRRRSNGGRNPHAAKPPRAGTKRVRQEAGR